METTTTVPTHPDYFYTRPETMLVKQNTNPLYKFFRQNHFTAGDYKQFLEAWESSPSPPLGKPPHDIPDIQGIWPKYKEACVHDVFHTFMYIAEKFKKGIFVRMVTGFEGLKVFLPFSKVSFSNEWFASIQVNKKRFASVVDMMRNVAEQEDKAFVESRVHKDIKSWYGNNGLVRLEFPISEGDSGCCMLRDMLDTLVKERRVPNATFFLNKRDFPLLTRDGYESYESFFGPRVPLVSHAYDRYATILGMTTTNRHADISIPTWEDWCRVSYWHDKRMFPKEFTTYPLPEEFDAVPWDQRVPTAVFRGASTGLGTTVSDNPRLFFAAESARQRRDMDGVLFLDAGITKWNLRPRKHPDSKFLETISVPQMPFSLVDPLTPLEQARYKYILHLPGHSCAYRLSLELYSGSVILLYPCEYKMWYSDRLVPWEHYVPIDPAKPGDVYDKIRWCKENDDECRQIATNAQSFAKTSLSRDAILDYLETLLWSMVKSYGEIRYAPRHLDDMLHQEIKAWVTQWKTRQQGMLSNPLFDHLFSHFSTDSLFSNRLLAQYIRFQLQKDPSFFDKREQTMMTETRNTTVKRLFFHHSDIVAKTCKKRPKNNQLPSFYAAIAGLNHLSESVPHFMYTYHTEERGKEWLTLLQHIEGPTLETFLKESRPSFEELVRIWLFLCLALHAAQQSMGFLHMDLYPWNVIVVQEKKPRVITYPLDSQSSIRVSTTLVPVMIDFEKSHFVHRGLHVYNTSPFRYCRLQDVISLVFSSLSIFLDLGVMLTEQDTFRVLQAMNFFSSPYTNNHRFHSLSHVKLFLRKHKKFSRMMYEPKTGLETKGPLDFFRRMVNSHFPHQTLSHPPRFDVVVKPLAFDVVEMELEMLEKVYVGSTTVSLEEKKMTLRRYWLATEKNVVAGDSHKISSWYGLLVRREILQRIRQRFEHFESVLRCKIWEHHVWEDLMGFPIYLPKEEIHNEWKKWLAISTSSPRGVPCPLPLLSTHLCPDCIEKSSVPSKPYSMAIVTQLLYLATRLFPERLSPNMDLFAMWTQDFNHEFDKFLKNSLIR